MSRWILAGVALVGGIWPFVVSAQVPEVPGVPAVPGAASAIPGAAAVPSAASAGSSAPSNIWSKLCPTPQQMQACKQKLCSCTLVQFLSGGLAPVSAMTGGLIGGCCPGPNQPNPADLALPADSAQGAAARIKKLEAEAAARRAAVRYLGTVDCSRFPEAELALIASLRGDENECVRYEAALALGRGCCCTKKVLEALVATVSGKKTNDPPEHSLRVRMAAAIALERCLIKYCELEPLIPDEKSPEKPVAPEPVPAKDAKASRDPLAEEGRRVLVAFKSRYGTPRRPTAEPPMAANPAPVQQAVAIGSVPTKPIATPPAYSELVPPQASLPPTGKRDLWSLLIHSRR